MKIKTLNPSLLARMMAAIAMGFLVLSVSSGAVAASSASSSTKAIQAQTPKSLETNTGKKFEDLTEQEVDALSQPERRAYYKWSNAKVDKELPEVEARLAKSHKELLEVEARNAKLDKALIAEYKIALSNFTILYNAQKTDSDTFKSLNESLLKILKTGEPAEIVAAIKKDPRIEKAIRAGENAR
jgi:hypothetical protein